MTRRIEKYLDQLANFDGYEQADKTVHSDEIIGKELKIVIPRRSMSTSQRDVFANLALRLHNKNIKLSVSEY